MTRHFPDLPHPKHQGLPPLFSAELVAWKGHWRLSVVGPGPEVVVDSIELGPADVLAVADPGEPGRHLIEQGPDTQPVPPTDAAAEALPSTGFVIDPAAQSDPTKRDGWVQVTRTCWTAPCHPTAT